MTQNELVDFMLKEPDEFIATFLGDDNQKRIENMRLYNDLEPVIKKAIEKRGLEQTKKFIYQHTKKDDAITENTPLTPSQFVAHALLDKNDEDIALFFGVGLHQIQKVRKNGDFVKELTRYALAIGYATVAKRFGIDIPDEIEKPTHAPSVFASVKEENNDETDGFVVGVVNSNQKHAIARVVGAMINGEPKCVTVFEHAAAYLNEHTSKGIQEAVERVKAQVVANHAAKSNGLSDDAKAALKELVQATGGKPAALVTHETLCNNGFSEQSPFKALETVSTDAVGRALYGGEVE